jgi:hypothetical protein
MPTGDVQVGFGCKVNCPQSCAADSALLATASTSTAKITIAPTFICFDNLSALIFSNV